MTKWRSVGVKLCIISIAIESETIVVGNEAERLQEDGKEGRTKHTALRDTVANTGSSGQTDC